MTSQLQFMPVEPIFMPHRAHLFSLRISHAIRDVLNEGYSRSHLLKDLMAGCVVGVIATPLAMALAIASGVAPQYGLYTISFSRLREPAIAWVA